MTVKEYHNDPYANYLRKVAIAESGNNPKAKNPNGSATGLYQFVSGTWKSLVDKYKLGYSLEDRNDPAKSEKVMRLFTKENEGRIKPVLGRDLNDADRYMTHFLGAGGASSFFKTLNSNPDAPISSVMSPNALMANKSVAYNRDGSLKTVKDVYGWASKKMSIDVPATTVVQEQPSIQEFQFSAPQNVQVSNLADPELFANLAVQKQESEFAQKLAQKQQEKLNEQAFLQEVLQATQVQFVEEEPYYQDGGIIEDNMGQWKYPGEITRINSGNITMSGVGYPVLGVDNLGNSKLMQPEQDYQFPGTSVTEYPILRNGGTRLKNRTL